jgi:hypothetical protein
VLLIGRGPPGSGKTVIAQEAAEAAWLEWGYDVLVLVPSGRLAEHYKERLGLGKLAELPAGDTSQAQLQIEEVTTFFAKTTGNSDSLGREGVLVQWWLERLTDKRLADWARKFPVASQPQFLRFVDALLEDDEDHVLRERDAQDLQCAPFFDALAELRNRASWRQLLRETRQAVGLKLRCETAKNGQDVLSQRRDVGRPLLLIVDECQDLIPSEWRALVRWCCGRCRSGAPTRLALLGDENQRVSPTAFSWASVKDYTINNAGLKPFNIAEAELPGSFRLSRQVARCAQSLFDASITVRSKTRHVPMADVESLPERNPVRVIVGDGAWEAIVQGIERGDCKALREGRRLRVIGPSGLAGPKGQYSAALDILSPQVAKGLEFRCVVVVNPLPGNVGPIAYDEATVAYAALTRAQESMICILEPAAWTRLSPVWGKIALDVSWWGPTDLQSTMEELSSYADEFDLDQEVAVLRARLDDIIASAPLEDPTDEGTAFLDELCSLATRAVHLERPQLVYHLSLNLVDLRPWYGNAVRRYKPHNPDPESTLGWLLILGELAAALRLCEGTLGLRDQEEQLRELLLVSAGETQLASYGLRVRDDLPPTVGTAEALVDLLGHKLTWQVRRCNWLAVMQEAS